MVRKCDKATWKSNYFLKLLKLLDEYPKCFIVGIDNVGSSQMQQIRQSLRGHAGDQKNIEQLLQEYYQKCTVSYFVEILMGKNTMIRKAIRGHLVKNPDLEKMLPHLVGNVGFVFTKEDLSDIKSKILSNKVAAPAKVGTLAQCDVSLPAQNTTMGPEKTSFFQALSIPTKISRGTIEILNEVKLIKKGEKVGASEASLLQMLDMKPFYYGLVVYQVYDSGTIFEPNVLDITEHDLRSRFMQGVQNIAALSLAIGYPTKVSVPHSFVNGLKNLMAIASVTDVTFKEFEKMKEILEDPTKLAAAVAATAAPVAAEETKQEEKEKEKGKEEDEDEEDFGLDLFG